VRPRRPASSACEHALIVADAAVMGEQSDCQPQSTHMTSSAHMIIEKRRLGPPQVSPADGLQSMRDAKRFGSERATSLAETTDRRPRAGRWAAGLNGDRSVQFSSLRLSGVCGRCTRGSWGLFSLSRRPESVTVHTIRAVLEERANRKTPGPASACTDGSSGVRPPSRWPRPNVQNGLFRGRTTVTAAS